jgi:hypothetical protein
MQPVDHPVTAILKWIGTAILIIGTVVNSAGHYPEGPLILALGGIVWLVVSIIWREYSLIVVNVAMTTASLAGLAWNYFG